MFYNVEDQSKALTLCSCLVALYCIAQLLFWPEAPVADLVLCMVLCLVAVFVLWHDSIVKRAYYYDEPVAGWWWFSAFSLSLAGACVMSFYMSRDLPQRLNWLVVSYVTVAFFIGPLTYPFRARPSKKMKY